MSSVDLFYLALVLFAFTGFAGALAYYSQTCATPNRKQSKPAVGQRLSMAAAH
jgi:hypothetical protein